MNDNSGGSRDQSQRVSHHGEHESPAQRGLSVRKTSGDRDKNKNAQRAFRQRKKEKEKAKCALTCICSSDNHARCCMLSLHSVKPTPVRPVMLCQGHAFYSDITVTAPI